MRRRQLVAIGWIPTLASIPACSGQLPMPEPSSIVIYSGERIQPDRERMAEVELWLTPTLDRINVDPSFLIRLTPASEITYPWDTLEIVADTANLELAGRAADGETPYLVYGFLRLMDDWGELEEALPEAAGESGYGIERAIVQRVADIWLLGRSVYDTQPFGPLDELVYSQAAGYLDDFLFATQGDRFAQEAEEYRDTFPGREQEFRAWFERTFGVSGPQFLRPPETDDSPDDSNDSDPAL
jgi:hypothetical protein